ncbi:MAG: nucleotide exchange factor GrpE [Anaerolineae bacterium]
MENEGQQPATPEQATTAKSAEGAAEDWKVKADEFKDKWLRTAADYDNYVKRQQRDRQRQDTDLRIRVIRKLLPALDDMNRALKNTPVDLANDPWVQGVVLIERKLRTILDDLDVQPIEAVGKMFDPAFHEAVMTEVSDLPEGTILEEFTKGYILAGQVVRATSVKVSSGSGR